jgi:hypothetical protein|nr:MAG TPA: hypothetical protein [Caudoviricetes sp.]
MTRTTYKKIPFDLELAKKITQNEAKGRIVTRDGLQARIICYDKSGAQSIYPIVALVQVEPDDEKTYTFTNEGFYCAGNKFCRDLLLEVPTYYRDYSNFVPMKWQPCLVRDTYSDTWRMAVCRGKDAYGIPIFYSENYSDGSCHWGHFLPISKVTERLVNTKKSYEELIKELDGNGKD